ncbi:MAG: hypothetical protein U0R26_10930 [Solirubrobacterales bacterium]
MPRRRPRRRRRPGRGARMVGGTARGGSRADVVVTVTPGHEPVILESDLRAGQHIAVLGADAGKSRGRAGGTATLPAFCDDQQASAGGELSGAVSAGMVSAEDVTLLGEAIVDPALGRRSDAEITLFDSTGLAIQDLAIVIAVYETWKSGEIEAQATAL